MDTSERESELGYAPGSLRLVGYFDWYEVRDRSLLDAALAGIEGVELGDDGVWVWRERAGDNRRLVAHLEYEGDGHIVLGTMNEKDADRCGEILTAAAGEAIEFMIGHVQHEHVGPSGCDDEVETS